MRFTKIARVLGGLLTFVTAPPMALIVLSFLPDSRYPAAFLGIGALPSVELAFWLFEKAGLDMALFQSTSRD